MFLQPIISKNHLWEDLAKRKQTKHHQQWQEPSVVLANLKQCNLPKEYRTSAHKVRWRLCLAVKPSGKQICRNYYRLIKMLLSVRVLKIDSEDAFLTKYKLKTGKIRSSCKNMCQQWWAKRLSTSISGCKPSNKTQNVKSLPLLR